MKVLLGTFALLFACGLFLPRESPRRAPGGRPEVQDAGAALDRARALKSAMRGLEGGALTRARRKAVAAYRRVRKAYPGTTEAAEAAFRAGELLRAAGEVRAARREFEAAAQDVDAGFRARAGVELGHLERRAGRLERALACFEEVALDKSAPAHTRDEAGLQCARVLLEDERLAEARRWGARVASSARNPLQRVHAHDVIACTWVAAGDLEAAAGALEQCRAALQSIAYEETDLGLRVRTAMEEQAAVARLRAAIEKRWRTSTRKQ